MEKKMFAKPVYKKINFLYTFIFKYYLKSFENILAIYKPHNLLV